MTHDTYKDVLIENDELRKHIWQATDEKDKLRAEVARLRAALEAVEWEYVDEINDEPVYACLWCGGQRKDGQPRNGHNKNCQRRLALLNKDAE